MSGINTGATYGYIQSLEAEIARLEAGNRQVRDILSECENDFHVCQTCGHQDDDATKTSNLYLLLRAALEGKK